MNYIAKQALSLGVNVLLGSGLWKSAKHFVNVLEDSSLTGAEKRQHAFELLRESGWQVASFILNFAIEAAVLFLKDRQGKTGGQ